MFTLTTTTNTLYKFPSFETRDEAAKWARAHAKAEILILTGSESAGFFESFHDDNSEIAGYNIYRRADFVGYCMPQQLIATIVIVVT